MLTLGCLLVHAESGTLASRSILRNSIARPATAVDAQKEFVRCPTPLPPCAALACARFNTLTTHNHTPLPICRATLPHDSRRQQLSRPFLEVAASSIFRGSPSKSISRQHTLCSGRPGSGHLPSRFRVTKFAPLCWEASAHTTHISRLTGSGA